MIRYWPANNDHDVLFTFSGNERVDSIYDSDYYGIELDKRNDVFKENYPLIGTYVISNWSDEE